MTPINTANLYPNLKAASAERSRLGLEASSFQKAPDQMTKDAYLLWKDQRKSAYREITRLIRVLKRVARTHGFSEGGYDQPRAQHELHHAKQVASDLMMHLATVKDANAKRYRLVHETESNSMAS